MSEKIRFILNRQELEASSGETVLQAALRHGIYIPHLCWRSDLEPFGGCRLCVVEIKDRGITVSCSAHVEDGMEVFSETENVQKIRKVALELLIANHNADCLACSKDSSCKLQEVAAYIGVEPERFKQLAHLVPDYQKDGSNPFFLRDHSRCVLCGICVRTCDEIVGVGAVDFAFRGFETKISPLMDRPIKESNCVSCGECVVRCPTGALVPKADAKASRKVRSICPYCGVGCGIVVEVRGDRVVGAQGDSRNVVNRGRLCVKGRFGLDFVNSDDRLRMPLLKKNGSFVEITWEEAIELSAEKLRSYGGERFAAVASARITNEDNYVVQKFTRAVMGTNNIDHCARICHAPSVVGLARTLGSGAMSNSIADMKDARCILAIGTNTTECHPVIGMEVKKAVRNGTSLIVCNPKAIELCRHADYWLQHRPGTDVALLLGIASVIVKEGLYDEDFIRERTEGFDELRKSVEKVEIEEIEKITGVEKRLIEAAARAYAGKKPSMILYGMGVTQHSHGTNNVLAISNLALLTGNIGRPGAGVCPLRGQNNVQGACDMGCLPVVYPGYQRVDVPEIREKFMKAWGCELSPAPGLTLTEMMDAAEEGKIKAMYVVGENPILSEPDASHTRRALESLDFLIVQDIFLTETAELADLVLPAVTFAEKDGTFVNTERRVQRIRKAIEPIGESKPDWWITCEIAKRMGARGFDYRGPEEIMREISSLTPSYGGISYSRIEMNGLQWPCPDENHPGTPILHTESFPTPNGRAKMVPVAYEPPFEQPDEEFDLVLTTVRSLYHYHTGTMTRRVRGLEELLGCEYVKVNPEDAERLGLSDGEDVRVVSRRGSVTAKAHVTDECSPGVVSMTFHFKESPTNVLTSPARDPEAKIPEAKVCAVRVEKIEN